MLSRGRNSLHLLKICQELTKQSSCYFYQLITHTAIIINFADIIIMRVIMSINKALYHIISLILLILDLLLIILYTQLIKYYK